ncbi:hypothetical protein BGY98DRAFT_1012659 [Russula aff. rugulosa BPL654]|nr:hypothetical protein BGY98DRAFT_1012659 [Russula aff. rugulosa BPL654]
MSAAKPTAARASVCVSTIMAPLDFDDEVEHSAEQLVAPPRADVSGGRSSWRGGYQCTTDASASPLARSYIPAS